MGVLTGLQPEKVFHYFDEICKIPHGSGNIEQISDYLVEFARERKLFYIQDALKNVIIIKEAFKGYENEPPVIIQGHMDMVTVKKPELVMDMKTEGLRLAVEGDRIYAEGTSLGGDDGIAVAYALALLDSDNLAHPRLEVVITVDEEVGMDGARGIDLSMLQGRRLLNLDSEEEGIFLTSCAGGARLNLTLPYTLTEKQGTAYSVRVEGLQGGHSGVEIQKERGNANVLLGRALNELLKEVSFCIKDIGGGLADNAIPREASATLILEEKDVLKLEEILVRLGQEIKEELAVKDPGVSIAVSKTGQGMFDCIKEGATRRIVSMLTALPGGVQAMSASVPGLVETSLNMGIISLLEQKKELLCTFSVRSSLDSAKYALISKVGAVAALAGASMQVSGDYPGWAYRTDSLLREKIVRIYERMYGKGPEIQAIHAGLECGLLASKIEDLDCISFGPDMSDIHTTEETLSISSTKRVWEYLVEFLAEKE